MEVRDVIPLFAICFDLVLAPRMMRKGDDVMAVTFSVVGQRDGGATDRARRGVSAFAMLRVL